MQPRHIDIQKDKGLTLHWPDGRTVFYPVAYLRKMSPSADMREARDKMRSNPLAVLPPELANLDAATLTITKAEKVGNYALRLTFSDGHHTGIYSWEYLREIEPQESS